jgi:hypothetical protein
MQNEAIILTVFKGPHGKSFSNISISWYVSCDPQYKNMTEDELCRSIKNQQANLSQACLLTDAMLCLKDSSLHTTLPL